MRLPPFFVSRGEKGGKEERGIGVLCCFQLYRAHQAIIKGGKKWRRTDGNFRKSFIYRNNNNDDLETMFVIVCPFFFFIFLLLDLFVTQLAFHSNRENREKERDTFLSWKRWWKL